MNAYDDLRRRVYFMLNELRKQNRNPEGYHLVLSRDVFVKALDAAPEEERQAHLDNQAWLLGMRLAFADDRTSHYIALTHTVRG